MRTTERARNLESSINVTEPCLGRYVIHGSSLRPANALVHGSPFLRRRSIAAGGASVTA